MKPSLEAPEPSVDAPQIAATDPVESGKPRGWWRSRRGRLILITAVMLLALGIAIEPIVREQTRLIISDLCTNRAHAKFNDGDLPAALEQCDKAVAWGPENPLTYFYRGQMRFDNNDLSGSLADYNKVIELSPTFAGGYSGRSEVYQRQGRYADAINDLTVALRNRPAWEPEPWNQRAYARALAGIELEQALSDVGEAISHSPNENAEYLDTRGLIQHKLGRNPEALADLNRSIQLIAAQRDQWERQAEKERRDPQVRKRQIAQFDHGLAVMYHHRSLVYAALGNEAKSKEDAAQAEQLGFDPAKGIE